jgi:hypothetical protein
MANRENRVARPAIGSTSRSPVRRRSRERPNYGAFSGVRRRTPKRGDWLAGAPGFEPGNGGIKIRPFPWVDKHLTTFDLDVRLVSYGTPSNEIVAIAEEFR